MAGGRYAGQTPRTACTVAAHKFQGGFTMHDGRYAAQAPRTACIVAAHKNQEAQLSHSSTSRDLLRT